MTAHGGPTRFFIYLTGDPGEALRQHDAELAVIQKLESVGVLAGGIAHDFNNMLTAILGNLSLLQQNLADQPEQLPLVRESIDACDSAKGLARQLLTFASGGDPVVETVDLGPVVASAAGFAARGSNVKVVVDAEAGPYLARVDKGQLAQVVQNLTLNAVQCMPLGGSVSLRLSNVAVAASETQPLAAGLYARIEVQDTGTGIPAEHLPRIFDPYFSTKGKGRGLGLAVSRSILAKHGGHLGVASTVGVGTTFTLHVPAGVVEPAAAPAPAKPAAPGARLLVMDDEASVVKVLKRILAKHGYAVEAAADGAAALEAWRRAREAGTPFAAVIMDLTVVDGMGGQEAVRHLLALDPQAKAIVSSGYSTGPVMARYREHGFCGVLAKPYQVGEVLAVLSEVLGRRS